jgi:hypothetical protein
MNGGIHAFNASSTILFYIGCFWLALAFPRSLFESRSLPFVFAYFSSTYICGIYVVRQTCLIPIFVLLMFSFIERKSSRLPYMLLLLLGFFHWSFLVFLPILFAWERQWIGFGSGYLVSAVKILASSVVIFGLAFLLRDFLGDRSGYLVSQDFVPKSPIIEIFKDSPLLILLSLRWSTGSRYSPLRINRKFLRLFRSAVFFQIFSSVVSGVSTVIARLFVPFEFLVPAVIFVEKESNSTRVFFNTLGMIALYGAICLFRLHFILDSSASLLF